MQRFYDLPIKRKLIVIVMVTSTLAVLLACAGLALYDLSVFRKEMERELGTLARVIEENSTAPLAFNDPAALQEVLSSLSAVPSIEGAAVYSADSTRFASYYREGKREALPESPPETGSYFRAHYLHRISPIVLNGNTMGRLYLRSSLSRWYDRVAQYVGIAAVVLLLSCGGAFLLASRLQRSISTPIHHLAETSRRISEESDYTVRAHVKGRDELGQLTDAFNRMLAQIQQRDAALVKAKEKAEEMAKLKSTFLNNMSHEIRTPLAGIIGYAEVLTEEVPEEQQDFAETIKISAKRLQDTLTSILKLAELESGHAAPNMKVTDVAEEAKGVVSLFRQLAEQKGLELHFHALTSSPYASLDSACLDRILNNLIGNAIKFTEEGYVAVEVEANAQQIHLRVKDTGIGIGDDFMDHLFDEFKQESTGLTRSHEGTGLGLAITEQLIDLMNGTIEVESSKGVGSTFTVAFPRFSSSGSVERVEESDHWKMTPV